MFHQLGIVRIGDKDDGVKIAIAGMEDVTDAQTVIRADLIDRSQHFSQTAARNGYIYCIECAAEMRHRSGGALASQPDLRSLLLIAGCTHIIPTMLLKDVGDLLRLRVQTFWVAIDFDDEHRSGVLWQACVCKRLDN